jgi:hypothetical protein
VASFIIIKSHGSCKRIRETNADTLPNFHEFHSLIKRRNIR